jgi:hypothetical protein
VGKIFFRTDVFDRQISFLGDLGADDSADVFVPEIGLNDIGPLILGGQLLTQHGHMGGISRTP